MRKTFFFLVSFALLTSLGAQVTFVIESLPDYTPPDDIIYIAGSLNGWSPGDPAYVLKKSEDEKWSFTADAVTEGTMIEFKFTRGSWETVEKGPLGEEMNNREFTYGNGDTIPVTIHNWFDFSAPVDSTAAWNVSILDEEFYMPQLDRKRRIWIYLPPDYNESSRQYTGVIHARRSKPF